MDYIKWIRDYVDNEPIILNFSGCVIFNEDGKILLQKNVIRTNGDS